MCCKNVPGSTYFILYILPCDRSFMIVVIVKQAAGVIPVVLRSNAPVRLRSSVLVLSCLVEFKCQRFFTRIIKMLYICCNCPRVCLLCLHLDSLCLEFLHVHIPTRCCPRPRSQFCFYLSYLFFLIISPSSN